MKKTSILTKVEMMTVLLGNKDLMDMLDIKIPKYRKCLVMKLKNMKHIHDASFDRLYERYVAMERAELQRLNDWHLARKSAKRIQNGIYRTLRLSHKITSAHMFFLGFSVVVLAFYLIV